MFGYVKPYVPALRVREYDYYKSLYCGLCRSMKKHTGTSSVYSLNYDCVFLALVYLALSGENVTIGQYRCAVHPFKKRPMAKDNPALQYATQISAVLTFANLADDIHDSHGAKKMGELLLLPAVTRIRRRALGCGFGLEEDKILALDQNISDLLLETTRMEQEATITPDGAADVFGRLLRAVFEAGVDGSNRRIAGEIGYHLGKWIYLCDAIDDFPSDLKSGNFNPFVVLAKGNADYLKQNRSMAQNALLLECRSALLALELIPFSPEHMCYGVLHNILELGLPHRAQQVLLHPGEKQKTYRHANFPAGKENLEEA